MEHSHISKTLPIPWATPVLFDSENSTCNHYDTSQNGIIIFLHTAFSGIQLGKNHALHVMTVFSKTCI